MGTLYCSDNSCTKVATHISQQDWLQYHDDPMYKDALRFAGYEHEDHMRMFYGYCFGKDVAFCDSHVASPKVRFTSHGNRTCMCCMEKAASGNFKGDGVEPLYVYYMCGDCVKLEDGSADTNRIGRGELLLVKSLNVYKTIGLHLTGGSIDVLSQNLAGTKKVDVTVKFRAPLKDLGVPTLSL